MTVFGRSSCNSTAVNPIRFLTAPIALGLFAGCAAPGGLPIAQGPNPIANGARPAVPVQFRIVVPRTPRHRGPRYVSPSTASVLIGFRHPPSSRIPGVTYNVKPGINTFTVPAPPGFDLFDVTTYSGRDAHGSRLSQLIDYPFTVARGKRNTIAVTLYGIPATVDVTLLGNGVLATGSATTGFQFGGTGALAAQQLSVVAKDADGNVIVAPGAPTIALTSSDSSKASVSAVPGSPNVFTVTPLAQTNAVPISPAPLTLTANAKPRFGLQVSATIGLQLEPIAYVMNSETITAYAPWNASAPLLTITDPNFFGPNSGIALDASGNVWASSYQGGTVAEYPPGSSTASRTITGLTHPTYSVATDTHGDVFVPENSASEVLEFTPAGGNTPSRTLSVGAPETVAVDGSGNLAVASDELGSHSVQVFAPGASTSPFATITAGINGPQWTTFDGSGNLYVTQIAAQDVVEFKPPFTNSSSVYKTFGSPSDFYYALGGAVDANGNVYVANYDNGTPGNSNILEYAPSAPATKVRSISLTGADSVAIDALGYLFAPATGSATEPVNVYAPGTSTSAVFSWSDGDTPAFVAVWP